MKVNKDGDLEIEVAVQDGWHCYILNAIALSLLLE